jgi:hypothetical protein
VPEELLVFEHCPVHSDGFGVSQRSRRAVHKSCRARLMRTDRGNLGERELKARPSNENTRFCYRNLAAEFRSRSYDADVSSIIA